MRPGHSKADPGQPYFPNRRLAAARQARGWTQQDLAERLGATALSVSRWERGEHAPGPFYNYRLCELFGKSTAEPGLDAGTPEASLPAPAPAPVSPASPVVVDPAIPLPLVGKRALVGRVPVLARLKAHLALSGHLVISGLNGLPGVGKTALAVALAHDPAIQAHFAGGILWAGLGPTPNVPAHLARWAGLLGLSLSERATGRSQDLWGEALRAAIGGRQMLIVLDDAWSLEAVLACKVGGPRTAYLVTTRLAPLAVQFAGEEASLVPELEEEDGLALLSQLAPAVFATAPEEARLLVRAVGGLPLALTLLGRYLHLHQGQQRRLRTALDRFRQAEERLRVSAEVAPLERPPHLVPGASLSLQATIAVSDELLEEQARLALYALSVFPPKPNSFSEAAALSVAQVGTEALDGLVDAGLLEPRGADRYSLHQIIADYASAKANSEDKTGQRRRLVAFFTEYLHAKKNNFAAVSQEQANISVAIQYADELDLHSDQLRLVLGYSEYLQARNLYDEGSHYLQKAEKEARAQKALPELAQVLLHRGAICEIQGKYTLAQACLREGLSLARRLGDRLLICRLLAILGITLNQSGDNALAEQFSLEGLSLARQMNNPYWSAQHLGNLGVIAHVQGHYTQAALYFEEGLSLARQNGDPYGIGRMLMDIGVIKTELGCFSEAIQYMQEALLFGRQTGDRQWIGRQLFNLGMVMSRSEDLTGAEGYLREGLEIARQIGLLQLVALSLDGLGELATKQSEYSSAEAYIQEALALGSQIGDPEIICDNWGLRGELALKQGDLQAATTAFQEMLRVLPKGHDFLQASADFGLARVAAAQGEHTKALQLAWESLHRFEVMGHEYARHVRAWLEEHTSSGE